MSIARLAISLATLLVLALGSLPAAVESGTAPASGLAPVKLPEVSTVGTIPAVLTEAERRKLVAFERELAARRTRPVRATTPPLLRSTHRPPAETVETRIPAAGPRDRTKPIEGPGEIAAREKERAR